MEFGEADAVAPFFLQVFDFFLKVPAKIVDKQKKAYYNM
jgi:hypothetical protein